MTRISLHVAQQHEAKPIIKYFHLRRYKHNSPFPIYLSDAYTLVVSGEGKLNTAAAVAYLASHFPNTTNNPWLNIGIAQTDNQLVASC